MTLIKIDQNKATHHLHDRLTGVFWADLDDLKASGLFLTSTLKNTPVNRLPELGPGRWFRELALDSAKKWVAVMGKQGYQLLTPEAEIRVWGPYRPKNWTGAVARPVTTGYQGDTEPFLILNRADFLLDADFVATRGFLDERRIENAERAARGLDPIKPFVPRTVDLIAKRDDL